MNFSTSKNGNAMIKRPLLLLSAVLGGLLVLAGGLPLATRVYLFYRQWGNGFGSLGMQVVPVVLLIVGVTVVALVWRKRSDAASESDQGM
jgi:uncharacterized BrkB/YihY/UPF0761 family membrane protein